MELTCSSQHNNLFLLTFYANQFDSLDEMGKFLKSHKLSKLIQEEITGLVLCLLKKLRDFPGGPWVKTLPSNAKDSGWIPGWGTKIPPASGPKKTKHKTEAIL